MKIALEVGSKADEASATWILRGNPDEYDIAILVAVLSSVYHSQVKAGLPQSRRPWRVIKSGATSYVKHGFGTAMWDHRASTSP